MPANSRWDLIQRSKGQSSRGMSTRDRKVARRRRRFFSDEAHFHISGCLNKQNMRYWSGVI